MGQAGEWETNDGNSGREGDGSPFTEAVTELKGISGT